MFDSDPLEEYPAKIAPPPGFFSSPYGADHGLKVTTCLCQMRYAPPGHNVELSTRHYRLRWLATIKETFTRESLADFGWDRIPHGQKLAHPQKKTGHLLRGDFRQ